MMNLKDEMVYMWDMTEEEAEQILRELFDDEMKRAEA